MTPTIRGELFRAWPEWEASAGQRAEAARRKRLYIGNYKAEVQTMVRSRINDADVREEICKFVSTAHGLVGAVADTCAVVYQRSVRRWLHKATELEAKALAALVSESGIAACGPALNALAWATGPVVAVPHVVKVHERLRLSVSLITADSYVVRRHETVPDVLTAVLYQRDDGVFVEITDAGWRYWTARGDSLEDGSYDAPHTLGYCPAAVIRARPWLPFDWRCTTDHVGLCDAALEVAYLSALGRWTRTQTSAPLTVIKSIADKYAKGQSIAHPTRPVVIDAMPGEASVKVHDRTTNPQLYLAEIQALVNAAVARYGIPPSAVTFTNDVTNWGTLSINVTPGALAAQRDAQTPLLRQGEISLWQIACDVVRASAHPKARDLPPADEVRERLRVAFPDLADPTVQEKRMAVFALQLPHGLASAEELLMEGRPELTYAEAEEEIRERLDAYARRLADLAARNTPKDAERGVELAAGDPEDPGGGMKSLAQKQGREGGRASAAARRDTADSEESTDT